jgi:hypothetical protein
MAPGYLHLHPNVNQGRWTEEFSQYDAAGCTSLPAAMEGKSAVLTGMT